MVFILRATIVRASNMPNPFAAIFIWLLTDINSNIFLLLSLPSRFLFLAFTAVTCVQEGRQGIEHIQSKCAIQMWYLVLRYGAHIVGSDMQMCS